MRKGAGIGTKVGNPSILHLIPPTYLTASGSAKETDKKFWRNMGELQEVNAQLPQSPTVLNLYFKSVVKQGLAELSELLYDGTLHVDHKPYYSELENWVEDHVDNGSKTKEAKQALLARALRHNPGLADSIASLAQDLAQALQQRNTELDALWQLMREDYAKPHNPPEAKTTSVRRGLGKLLVLEPSIRQLVYAGYNKRSGIRSDNLPQYAYELGFFKQSLVGAHVNDPEIKAALDLLGGETCESVLQQAPASMETWINPLRDLARVATHVDFIYENYDQIIDPEGLRELLSRCFNDPAGLSGEAGDEKVWVYEIMISLIKAETGRLQGYGLAQLAEDTGLVETGEGAPLARFIIPKFTQREELLEPDHLRMLANGLAERFQTNVSRKKVLGSSVPFMLNSHVKRLDSCSIGHASPCNIE